MTTSHTDPRVGTDFGPYRIESVLGRGGMGVVYLAVQERLRRRVALKVLPPELAGDPDFRARFERESQMAAAIDDPNILPIYEAGEVDGELFIAMRYVEGTDLETRLRAGPLEPRAVVHLLGQVASALDTAHLRGLVHRDVKPANILITGREDERGDHAYLTDFGLTKLRTQDTSLTRAGAIMGTLDYMAPEQLEGRELDGAADQYALAAIAFSALTGGRPYERDSEAALITAILRDPPPSAHEAVSTLPEAVDAVFARGMAKSPSGRYSSCASFVSELRSALGVTATTSAAAPLPARLGGRGLVIAGVAVAVGLLALVGVGAWLGGGAAPASSPSPSVGVAPSASLNPDPSAFPTADEAALRALLPPDVAIRCKRGSYDNVVADSGASSRPLASLACTLSGRGFEGTAPDRVTAIRLRDSALVTADRVVDRAAKEHDVPPGECAAEELPATGVWAPDGAEVGRVACWIEGGDAVVEWSHQRDGLVFRVARGNRDEGGVIGLWQSIGLTAWAAIREAAGGVDPDAFPTATESEVLAMLPDDIGALCERGSGTALDTEAAGRTVLPIANLSCDLPPDAGADTLEVHRLAASDTFTPESVIGIEARSRGVEPGDCATSGRAHGRWSVGGQEVGAVVCYRTPDQTANISWTRTARDLYLWAIRKDGDQAALWSWFTQNARFIGP